MTTDLLESDKAVSALSLDFVWVRHYRCLCHLGVFHKRGLNLSGTQQVPRNIDHVIYSSGHPDVAITVLLPSCWLNQIDQSESSIQPNWSIFAAIQHIHVFYMKKMVKKHIFGICGLFSLSWQPSHHISVHNLNLHDFSFQNTYRLHYENETRKCYNFNLKFFFISFEGKLKNYWFDAFLSHKMLNISHITL